MFVGELKLAFPLLLTLHTLDEESPDTERSHQLIRDARRNQRAL